MCAYLHEELLKYSTFNHGYSSKHAYKRIHATVKSFSFSLNLITYYKLIGCKKFS